MGNSSRKIKKSKDANIDIDDDVGDPIDNSDIIDKTEPHSPPKQTKTSSYKDDDQKVNDNLTSNNHNINQSVDNATKNKPNEYTFDDDDDENENDGFDNDDEKKAEDNDYEFDDDDGGGDDWDDVELLEDGQQKIIHMEDEDAETALKRALEKRRIEQADASKFWKCGKCTFLNHPSRAICMSCRLPQIDIVYHILQSDEDDVQTCPKCQGVMLSTNMKTMCLIVNH